MSDAERELDRGDEHQTTKLHRLEENIRAAAIELTPDDVREIERVVSKVAVHGDRYPERLEQLTGR